LEQAWRSERTADTADNIWLEVAPLHNQSGYLRMYLAPGSGVFWNCGTSLRARNKVAAAVRLTEQLSPLMSRDLAKGTPVDTLAHAIASNDASTCASGEHCRSLTQSLVNGSNAQEHVYLATWLTRVAVGDARATLEWERADQSSASTVFDQILWEWGKRVGYDSIQLAMQPQPSCGLLLATELLDLRVRRTTDALPFLAIRDPLVEPAVRVASCQVAADKSSRRAFGLSLFCTGSMMERSARCTADATPRGRHGARPLLRRRFEACTSVG